MTRLPNFPEMGAVTLAQAQEIAVQIAADSSFGPKVAAYTNAAMAVLPAGDASRTALQSSVVRRIDTARAVIDYATPIASGRFPRLPSPRALTQTQARQQVQRALYGSLAQLTGNVVVTAVQALPTTDSARQAWQTMLELRLASEQLIVTNGPVQLADLNPGPAPAP